MTSTVPRGPPGPRRRSRRRWRGRSRRPNTPDGADRDLVLAVAAGQHAGQPAHGRASSSVAGQVDQAAPAVGLLQRGDPAEAPHLRLRRVRDRSAGRSTPRRGSAHHSGASTPGVAERLDQRDRARPTAPRGDGVGATRPAPAATARPATAPARLEPRAAASGEPARSSVAVEPHDHGTALGAAPRAATGLHARRRQASRRGPRADDAARSPAGGASADGSARTRLSTATPVPPRVHGPEPASAVDGRHRARRRSQ